jgi:hypothetical protein
LVGGGIGRGKEEKRTVSAMVASLSPDLRRVVGC